MTDTHTRIEQRLDRIEVTLKLICEAVGCVPTADQMANDERNSDVQKPLKADRLISVSQAAKIAKCGTSSIYRWATDFLIGIKTPSGSWQISEARLRAFLRGELGEFGEAQRVHMGREISDREIQNLELNK